MTKRTIAYHAVNADTDCPDGICAAWITVRALALPPEQYNLVPIVHRSDEDYLQPDYQLPFVLKGNIYILDIAFPEPLLRFIAPRVNKLTIIDHHKTNQHVENLVRAGNIAGVFDLSECAATAAWKYFYGTGISSKLKQPWFLPYVRQRDIGADGYYLGSIPESEAIGEAMSVRRRQYGIGAEVFPFFDELVNIPKDEIVAEGMPMIEARNRAIESYFEIAPIALLTVGDHRVPFFDLQEHPDLHRHISMIGAKAALKHYVFPFVALTTDGESISLRSRPDGLDVAIVAKQFGGGGHATAAGYKINK